MDCCSKRRVPFIYTIVHCTISLVFFLLFLSSPLWIPKTLSFSILLSKMVGPNSMFVVCNLIIVFLFWESRWSSGSEASKDIYAEYMEMRRKFQRREENTLKLDESIPRVAKDHAEEEDGGVEKDSMATCSFDDCKLEKNLNPVEAGEDVQEEELIPSSNDAEDDMEEEEEEEAEEDSLLTEEMNRKFDEFIEKVKRRRRMEQLMLV